MLCFSVYAVWDGRVRCGVYFVCSVCYTSNQTSQTSQTISLWAIMVHSWCDLWCHDDTHLFDLEMCHVYLYTRMYYENMWLLPLWHGVHPFKWAIIQLVYIISFKLSYQLSHHRFRRRWQYSHIYWPIILTPTRDNFDVFFKVFTIHAWFFFNKGHFFLLKT